MAPRRSRAESNKTRTIVGSARRIALDRGAAAVKQQMGQREVWQGEMWAYYDTNSVMKQSVIYTGSVASKVRVYAAAIPLDDPDGDPIPVGEPEAGVDAALAAAATEELARLRSELGGQPEILRLINMNLEVAGEGFLVGLGARDEQRDPYTDKVTREATLESWTVHSISEVSVTGNGKTVIKEDGKGRGVALDPTMGDSIIRIWVRHPQWTTRADTAMRGVLMELRTLQALANERLAVSQGNLTRGVFKVANGLALAGAAPTPEGDADEDPLLNALSAAFVNPAGNPDDEHTLDYVYVRGERDDLKNEVFGPIDITRKRDAELKAEVESLVDAYARGVNLPPEKVLGHQQTTFANARQIDQDEFDDYHDPRMRAIVDAITVGYLVPNLLAREFDPVQVQRIIAWFDPSDLFGEPPIEEAADRGVAIGTISHAAWRNARGFTDDDAPDALERIINAGLGASRIPPEIILAMLEPLAKAAGITLPTPAEALLPVTAPLVPPSGALPPRTPAAASFESRVLLAAMQIQESLRFAGIDPRTLAIALPPVVQHGPVTAIGSRLGQIDQRLFLRLQTAASAAMERALERAGNRLRNRLTASAKDLVTDCPARHVAARLGPSLVADAADDDDLLDGAWDDLGASYLVWTLGAHRDASRLAATVVDFDQDRYDELAAEETAASWEWTAAELRALALQRLYNPDPTIALGEGNPSLSVPAGLLRSAMARAGGAPTNAGNGPVGGVATGQQLMDTLRDGGASVGKWTWTYGGSANPFPPHEALDGVEFDSYEDPELANSEDFPSFAFFFPGDHDGCECWIDPTIDGPSADLAAPDE